MVVDRQGLGQFVKALHSHRPLLMDGAMGTELSRFPHQAGECFESWNLTHPERVLAVHQAYANAGAEVFLTNTFQLLKAAAGELGSNLQTVRDRAIQWLSAAYGLCRSVAGPDRFVLACFGPYFDVASKQEVNDNTWLRLALPFLGPVDGILFETRSTAGVEYSIRLVGRLIPDLPILLSIAFKRTADGSIVSQSGHSPEWFAARAKQWKLAALGSNCGHGIGLDDMLAIVKRYRATTDIPLFVRPNAGTPKLRARRWIYPVKPEMLEEWSKEILQAGAQMVGGCCGTTPEHIAVLRASFDRDST